VGSRDLEEGAPVSIEAPAEVPAEAPAEDA